MHRRVLAALAVAAVLCAAPGIASAEVLKLGAELSGANESPPNDSPATGMAEAEFDTQSRELTWTVTFEGLTGPLIGAHIHGPADPGTNAGIMLPFGSLESPIEGSAMLNEEQAKQLLDGGLYVNLHTEAHPGGELRGQLKTSD